MEGKKPTSSASSSLSSDLFGSKDSMYGSVTSNSSSSGIFSSVFSPPSTGLGMERRQKNHNQVWNGKQTSDDGNPQGSQHQKLPSKDRSSVFHSETVEPCNFSSSLYYGGPDVCSHPSRTRTSGTSPIYTKDGGEDDSNNSNSASRGNWWQGSLYY